MLSCFPPSSSFFSGKMACTRRECIRLHIQSMQGSLPPTYIPSILLPPSPTFPNHTWSWVSEILICSLPCHILKGWVTVSDIKAILHILHLQEDSGPASSDGCTIASLSFVKQWKIKQFRFQWNVNSSLGSILSLQVQSWHLSELIIVVCILIHSHILRTIPSVLTAQGIVCLWA